MDYIKNVASVLEMVEPVDGVIKISAEVRDLLVQLLRERERWISVKDEMPAETHSMFYKFYGTEKWRDAMWQEESDNVLVAIAFEDGSQFVTSGYTQDGKWHTGISKMLPYTVTHWMQMPEPPEVMQDGIQ